MKYIIVTGGLGFIGSNTVIQLIQNGYTPIIFDNLHNSSINIIDIIYDITGHDVIFHKVDITSDEIFRCMNQYATYNIVGILHFAALKSVSQSIQNPLLYYNNNIKGLLNMLGIMQTYSIPNFIFSSSATVYSSTNSLPLKEDQLVGSNLTCPYGKTKYFCEEILQDFYTHNSNKNILIFRYFNPIGSDATYQLGDNPKQTPENLFPIIKEVIEGKRNVLHIYGNDYTTNDGTPERDYINVEDLARGHILGLSFLEQHTKKNNVKGVCEHINLGEGKGTSVMDIIKGFKTFCNIDIPYEYNDKRQGDVGCVYANCDKAKRLLQWETKKTLQDSITSYVYFIKYIKNSLKYREHI